MYNTYMFGFTYEDADIETEVIKSYLNIDKPLKGLMILSGGCTMFKISKFFSSGELTAVDLNKEQITLVKHKLYLLDRDPQKYDDFIDTINMPFDNLFYQIKNNASFTDIFSTQNLIHHFGNSAVSNTTDDFAKHFIKIYNNQTNKSIWDWIWNRNLECKKYNIELINDLKYIQKTKINYGNFEDFLFPNTYDFIQTSNITDWMDYTTFSSFCENLKKSLKPNGIALLRRLLSNNILNIKFPNAILYEDKTNFYNETICFINK